MANKKRKRASRKGAGRGAGKPKGRAAATEFPLSAPYEFEGFTTAEETLGMLEPLLDRLDIEPNILVAREGENAHGTWGRIYTKSGTQWVVQGHTLEPKANAPTGAPIPLGSYPFTRWDSPKLLKTLRLHNTSPRTDILIHVGNLQDETKGCILAAKSVDNTTTPTRLVNSRVLTDWLYDNFESGVLAIQSK